MFRSLPRCRPGFTRTRAVIDRLISDLDALKEYPGNGSITVDFWIEQSETRVQPMVDYTRQLVESERG